MNAPPTSQPPIGHRPIEHTPTELGLIVGRLRAAGCVAAEEEAAELTGAAPDAATLERWLDRREQGQPLAWIVGSTSFCGRRVAVWPGVYGPEPQTEELAERAAALLPPQGWALDLCTGSGAVAAHLRHQVPTAAVIGTDIDPTSARCARHNGVPTVVGDLAGPIGGHRRFDLVTAVPPYVPHPAIALLPTDLRDHVPLRALDGGPDGLDLTRRVIVAAHHLLRPGGWLLCEAGGDQGPVLESKLTASGFDAVELWYDDDGDLRGVAARRH